MLGNEGHSTSLHSSRSPPEGHSRQVESSIQQCPAPNTALPPWALFHSLLLLADLLLRARALGRVGWKKIGCGKDLWPAAFQVSSFWAILWMHEDLISKTLDWSSAYWEKEDWLLCFECPSMWMNLMQWTNESWVSWANVWNKLVIQRCSKQKIAFTICSQAFLPPPTPPPLWKKIGCGKDLWPAAFQVSSFWAISWMHEDLISKTLDWSSAYWEKEDWLLCFECPSMWMNLMQ